MDIRIIYLINLIIWIWVIYVFSKSKKITVKLNVNKNYITTIIFFILGIIIYLKNPHLITILNFVSFSLAGFVLDNSSGGFSNEGIFIFGKIHYYHKIENYELEKKNGGHRLKFRSNKKDYYLYLNNIDISLIKQYLLKIRRHK